MTHLLGDEQGSAFDLDTLLFTAFEDGGVFNYAGQAEVREIKDMLKVDSKAQTLEQVLSLPIRQAPYTLFQGKARDEVHAVVHSILMEDPNLGGMSTPINLVLAQMCGAFLYKKAFFEKVWARKMIDGKSRVGLDKLAWRPAGTCAIERDAAHGEFMGFRQMPVRLEDTDERRFNAFRSFVYIHGQHRDPLEGVSDLTITQWCFKTKQKVRFLWYQFLEGQALPKTIVKSSDETAADKAAKKIVGLRSGGVVGLDDQTSVDALESSGRGAAEFKAAMQWLDAEASSSVLAGFTDLAATAAQGTGSFALSKDQTDFFLMSRQAVSKEMEDSINQYLIADIVRWNFGPNEIAPKFKFGPIATDDKTESVALLQATAQTPVNQSVLPQEFFNELTLRVAGFLDLDETIVREGLVRKQKQAEAQATASPDPNIAAHPQVAGVKAAVDTATNAVQQKVLSQVQGAM